MSKTHIERVVAHFEPNTVPSIPDREWKKIVPWNQGAYLVARESGATIRLAMVDVPLTSVEKSST